MKLIRQGLRLILIGAVLHVAAMAGTPSPDQVANVKAALVRRLCWEDYWRARTFPPGSNISLKMWFHGDKLQVEAKGSLAWWPKVPGTTTEFYKGRIKDGRVALFDMEGYFTPDPKDTRGLAFEEQKRKPTEGWELHIDHVSMPTNCTPEFSPTSPEKQEILRSLIKNVDFILQFGRPEQSAARYPIVTLIMADFNLDYPHTYVLVQPFKDVFMFRLPPDAKAAKKWEREGYPPAKQIYDPPAALVKKIEQHGIVESLRRKPGKRPWSQFENQEPDVKGQK